jgi:hypothetical protein
MPGSLSDNLAQNTSKITQSITNSVIANAKMAHNFSSANKKIISKYNGKFLDM